MLYYAPVPERKNKLNGYGEDLKGQQDVVERHHMTNKARFSAKKSEKIALNAKDLLKPADNKINGYGMPV